MSVGWREEALSSARGHLDDDVRAWLANLSAAHSALRHEIHKGKNKKLLEAGAGLALLGKAMRRAPDQLVAHLRRRGAESGSADLALLRQISEHEKAERKLAVVNAQLRQEIAGHEGLERQRRDVERGLREGHERFESAFGNAPIGMALVAMDGRWLQINDALCRITGYSEDELKATELGTITHPEDLHLDAEELQQLLGGGIGSYQVEKRYRHAWGHYVWVLVTVSLVRNDESQALYVIMQVQDISERKELARRLEFLVDHDFLTGLLNRRHFEQELARETERVARYGDPGAVLMIDLDHFKDVNDTFGHKAGDDLLKGVAGLLRQRARNTDMLARVGGDEFAVLLPQTEADQAEIVADEIVKTLDRKTAVLANQSIHLTASVGVAMFDGLSDTEVLAYADLAMYEAKKAGRNRFALYRPAKGRRIPTRFTEAEQIRDALEKDRLILYGQPILDLHENKVCQYELLLRLPDKRRREPLPPSAFLYVAERFGLMQAIDTWVIRKAIALIAKHARAGPRLVLNVNISAKSIADPKFAALIERDLTEAGIDPACLIFELTETAAVGNIEEARAFAARLRGLGCQFALDDFGVGFGSFYYIKNIPFDYLKIDGDFIRSLASSAMDQLVVRAIVSIAQGMGKKTVAEFVADDAAARLLREMGVDYAQGYHIGPPRPIAEILVARPR